MKKPALLCALAAVTAFPAPSHADPAEPPLGNKCAFNSSTDVTREAGWQVGDLRAGPMVTVLEGGHLHCAIHVNNNTHDGAEAASFNFTATAGVVVGVMPDLLHYQATAADEISLCSEWRGANGTKYWIGGNTAAAQLGSWSPTPGLCGVAGTVWVATPDGALCIYY